MNKINTRLAKFGIVIVLFILIWLYYNSHSGVESFYGIPTMTSARYHLPQRSLERDIFTMPGHDGATDCDLCDLDKTEWERADDLNQEGVWSARAANCRKCAQAHTDLVVRRRSLQAAAERLRSVYSY
jgi:hypothetical protein